MQLFSIENLSLAAEATVILLLLSFAWPRKTIEPPQEISGEKTISWEPAKFYFLRSSTFRGLYLKYFRESQENGSPTLSTSTLYVPPEIEDEPDKPSIPTPWQDRLTRLLNRQGFDAVLKEWMAIPEHQRGNSCMSMTNVSTYSDLVTTHGAMVTEQAIQRLASQLALSLSTQAIIARYLPDRFIVLHFAAQLADCHQGIEAVQQSIAEVGFFKVAGEPFPLPCSTSIVALGSSVTANTKIDELDEGVIEAQQSGRTILSRVDENWIDSPPASDLPKPRAKPKTSDSQAEKPFNQSDAVNESKSKAAALEQETPSSSKKPVEGQSENSNAPQPSTDISAVANADDIAALFAQINSNKASKALENPKQVEPSSAATVPAVALAQVNPPAAAVAVDVAEVATADDIAALFASMKPTAPVAPAAVPATAAPVIPVAPAAITTPAAATIPVAGSTSSKPNGLKLDVDVSEAASADDIAALFATVKPNAVKSTVPSTPTAPTEKKQATAPNPIPDEQAPASQAASLPTSAEELNQAATADDIASLFQTVKPKAIQTTPPTSPSGASPKPAPAAAPPQDLSSNASSDDIAALFASMKK